MISFATGRVTLGAIGCPGMPGCSRANSSALTPVWVSPSWSLSPAPGGGGGGGGGGGASASNATVAPGSGLRRRRRRQVAERRRRWRHGLGGGRIGRRRRRVAAAARPARATAAGSRGSAPAVRWPPPGLGHLRPRRFVLGLGHDRRRLVGRGLVVDRRLGVRLGHGLRRGVRLELGLGLDLDRRGQDRRDLGVRGQLTGRGQVDAGHAHQATVDREVRPGDRRSPTVTASG